MKTLKRPPKGKSEDIMITCKLCNTRLERKNLRRDGSMLCPVCGQIYWKAAVDRAMRGTEHRHLAAEIESNYMRESRRSTEMYARKVRIA